ELVAELGGYFLDVCPERMLIFVRRVVAVPTGEISQRGIGLQVNEVFIVVYLKHRLGGVGDSPDDDRGDMDGRAVLVVDFERLALLRAWLDHAPRRVFYFFGRAHARFKCANPQGYFLPPIQRIAVEEPHLPERTGVLAEECNHPSLVRRVYDKAEQAED